jgi:hypothetical protein
MLVFLAIATFQAAVIPTFGPRDEASHVGYALLVGEGELPTIDTPIPREAIPRVAGVLDGRDPERQDVWTANHPPLYYALAAVPVRLGLLTRPSLAGLRVARLTSVLFGAAALLLVPLLAMQLAPGRPEIAVAATALAAVLPVFLLASSVLYNDALAVATSLATLLAALVVLRRGPSRARLAAVAAAASLAALTRSSGLLVAGVAVLIVLAEPWLAGRRPPARQVLAAAGGAGLVAGVVALTSGWFYVRNWRLYGDPTGAAALLAKFERGTNGSTFELLRSPGHWFVQVQRPFDYSFYEYRGAASARTVAVILLAAVPLAGLLLAALRRRPRRPDRRLVAAWLAGLLLLVLLGVSTAQFAGRGGVGHGRYMLPALAVLATAAAIGLRALPGGRRGLVTVGLLAVGAAVSQFVLDAWLIRRMGLTGDASALAVVIRALGVPHPALLLVPLGLVVAAGLALVARSLWRLGEPSVAPVEENTGGARPATSTPWHGGR